MGIISEKIKELLESAWWPGEIEVNKNYFRTHDDCDGDTSEGVSLTFSVDGDAHIICTRRAMQSCRYRIPSIGGGRSPRVRKALLILALAIKLDNEDGF